MQLQIHLDYLNIYCLCLSLFCCAHWVLCAMGLRLHFDRFACRVLRDIFLFANEIQMVNYIIYLFQFEISSSFPNSEIMRWVKQENSKICHPKALILLFVSYYRLWWLISIIPYDRHRQWCKRIAIKFQNEMKAWNGQTWQEIPCTLDILFILFTLYTLIGWMVNSRST